MGAADQKAKKRNRSINIIGAGPGGLAAAMILAHRGFNVRVFEKQSQVGGRNAELRLGPYRFDLGPTFLMMKFILDEIFQQTKRKTSDYLDCRPLDPMYRLNFHDRSLMVYRDREKMRAEIERVFPGEGQALDRFYQRESKRFENLYPCLQKDYASFTSLVRPNLLKVLPHVALGQSLYDILSGYFQHEELRLAFTFQSKYLGMSPWECPGLFSMIPYTEHAHGIYHVQGGLCQISQAFAQVAQEEGAHIMTDAPVRRVLVENNKAVGVQLEGGEVFMSDEVVINADFSHAMKTLFQQNELKKYNTQKLEKYKYSCSTFMIFLGLNKIYDLDHHNIYFARDYRKNINDISHGHKISDDFSIYVRNASLTDPALAPPGHSGLYILVPVPNQRSGFDWKIHEGEFKNKVLSFLESQPGLYDLRQHIECERVITPDDWENKLSVHVGATFNLSHSLDQLLYFRPRNQFEDVQNVYLVGGGTHPGSGLPSIFESARISSNLISGKYKGVPGRRSVHTVS